MIMIKLNSSLSKLAKEFVPVEKQIVQAIEAAGFQHLRKSLNSRSAVNRFKTPTGDFYTTYKTGYVRKEWKNRGSSFINMTPISRNIVPNEEHRLLMILRIARKNSKKGWGAKDID